MQDFADGLRLIDLEVGVVCLTANTEPSFAAQSYKASMDEQTLPPAHPLGDQGGDPLPRAARFQPPGKVPLFGAAPGNCERAEAS